MPRDASRAMLKLYEHGLRCGLNTDQATAAAAALHTKYGERFVAFYGDDTVTTQTLGEAIEIGTRLAGIALPGGADTFQPEGESHGLTE
jgi:hypothetical protein